MTTKSVAQCVEYCQENSIRSAKTFIRIGDGRYVKDYAYWIAADGDSSKSQEIFIFRKKYLFMTHGFDRFVFVTSSVQSKESNSGSLIGSFQFHTRRDNGEKEDASTLLFYSSTADNDIVRYECIVEENGTQKREEGHVNYGNEVWLIKFTDIRSGENNESKKILEVKFYDKNNKLIYTY